MNVRVRFNNARNRFRNLRFIFKAMERENVQSGSFYVLTFRICWSGTVTSILIVLGQSDLGSYRFKRKGETVRQGKERFSSSLIRYETGAVLAQYSAAISFLMSLSKKGKRRIGSLR